MKRILIAAFCATGASYAAMAQDAAPPQPSAAQVQTDPSAAKPSGPMTPSTEAVPSPEVAAPAALTPTATAAPVVTDDDMKKWIGKTVYSSDGKNLGEVAAIVRGSDNKLTEIHADIGGFLGIGETRVRLPNDQIDSISDDGVKLNINKETANALPAIE